MKNFISSVSLCVVLSFSMFQSASAQLTRLSEGEFDALGEATGVIDFETVPTPCVSAIDFLNFETPQCILAKAGYGNPELTDYEFVYDQGVLLHGPYHPNGTGLKYSNDWRGNSWASPFLEFYQEALAGGNDILIMPPGRNAARPSGGSIMNISFEHTTKPSRFGMRIGSIEGPTPCCVSITFVFEMTSGNNLTHTIGPHSIENGSLGWQEFTGFDFGNDTIESIELGQLGHQPVVDDIKWGGGPKRPISVLFVNGIGTEPMAANASFKLLERRIKATIDENKLTNVNFDYVNSNTDGHALDILELMRQRREFSQLESKAFFRSLFSWRLSSDDFKRVFKEVVAEKVADETTRDPVLRRIRDYIETFHAIGGDVIIVSYSQGNAYALSAYLGVEDPNLKERLSVVGVATPLNHKPTNSQHITEKNDLIINYVRDRFGALEHTTDNTNIRAFDWALASLGHSFDDIYIASDTETLTDISEAVSNEINRLNSIP